MKKILLISILFAFLSGTVGADMTVERWKVHRDYYTSSGPWVFWYKTTHDPEFQRQTDEFKAALTALFFND